MANEIVYYGIYNTTESRNLRLRSIAPYRCRMEKIDDRVIAVNRSFDPVEVFPPELSSRCLLHALHSGADYHLYQPDLLQMLHVSEKWYRYIISEPLLWSEISIDCSTPDMLAMLATFVHLSGTAPLDVVIYGDPGTSWNEIGSILLPHSQRIRTLDFQPISSFDEEGRNAHMSSAKRVLGSFRCLTGLKELDFCIPIDVHSFDLDLPTIPRGVLVRNTLRISRLQVDPEIASLRNYARIATKHCLDDIIPLLCSLSVRDLHLCGGSVAQTSTPNIEIPLEVVSHLKRVTCEQPYYTGLGKLLKLAAHQLSYLELHVAHSNIQEIINVLSKLVKLKQLRLHFFKGETAIARTSHPSCGAVIHDLNTLLIFGLGGEIFYPLFTAFVAMYPSVRHVTIALFSFSPSCAAYLASLSYIEELHYNCEGNTTLQPIMRSPSMQLLSAKAHHISQYSKLPNLLRLVLSFGDNSARFGKVCLPCLRTLTIRGPSGGLDLHLDPSDYPELRMLTIVHQKLQWQLTSLPKLVSITLHSDTPDRHHGTLLCAALLYYPEYCPALQQIWFSAPVEWDILFLMLERRNCGTKSVKKINAVSLPFVPFGLRKPLALLLEGRMAERPSNLELSFKATQELVCDSTVPGCLTCLRHTRPHCTELENPRQVSRPLELENVFVAYQEPPGDVPPYIRDWVLQYERLKEEWKYLEIYRINYCHRWIEMLWV